MSEAKLLRARMAVWREMWRRAGLAAVWPAEFNPWAQAGALTMTAYALHTRHGRRGLR